jgi:hypothetical protein
MEALRKVFPSANITFRLADPAYRSREPAERRALELAASARPSAEISLELAASEFDAASLMFDLHSRGIVASTRSSDATVGADPVGAIKDLLAIADQRFEARRYEAAARSLRRGAGPRPAQPEREEGRPGGDRGARPRAGAQHREAGQGPGPAHDARGPHAREHRPSGGLPASRASTASGTCRSILKICPIAEETALLIFARLASRGIIDLVDAG